MGTNRGISKAKSVVCIYCHSKKVVKNGQRKAKFQTIQKYLCKECNRHFLDTEKRVPNKTYPTQTILRAISFYNLGYSQQKVSNIISKRYKIKVPQRTISQWLSEYRNICTFYKIRKEATNFYSPDEIIEDHVLMHNNLPYKFQIHKAKLQILCQSKVYNNKFTDNSKFYQPLKSYFERIPTKDFPNHIFSQHHDRGPNQTQENKSDKTSKAGEIGRLSRSSQLKFKTLDFVKQEKYNQANKLAYLALNLARNNRERHQSIQDFMLINDSTTIATEIPVYLTKDDIAYFKDKGFIFNFESYQTPITGHIDFLQVRNGIIHILDYKPGANKVNAVNQLTIYALALASRTKLAVKDFKCAWFDENNCYEFFPLHVVYKLREK